MSLRDTENFATPQTFFVDFADLEAKMTSGSVQPRTSRSASRPRRVMTSVDEQTKSTRKNTQDATRAVLTWVAAVCEHDTELSLDDILSQCLRPGPDIQSVNYAGLAEQINQTLGIELSPKRVKTAINQLRRCRDAKAPTMTQPNIKQKLDQLHDRLETDYRALIESGSDDHLHVRRDISIDVLGAVRRAAGRLIENDYGEGIPPEVDIDDLEDRFLDFVRDVVSPRSNEDQPRQSLQNDLRRLLVSLCDYDASAECDMRLVVDGSRVVNDLAGPDSLPGLISQLNVLVAGRSLLDSQLYVAEMIRLAEAAAELHDDTATKSLMNHVRRLPEEQRLPSPLRVASYCHNNASTHLLDGIYNDQLPVDSMDKARWSFNQMRTRDSGFDLIKTTQVILLTVEAKLGGDDKPILEHFKQLGRAGTLAILTNLMRFDNSPVLTQAAQQHAIAAIPDIKHQLIHTR
jgi:hypothetical protein